MRNQLLQEEQILDQERGKIMENQLKYDIQQYNTTKKQWESVIITAYPQIFAPVANLKGIIRFVPVHITPIKVN